MYDSESVVAVPSCQRLGITGGIGSGKSLVCAILERLNYPVYHADPRAKALMQEDPDLRAELCDAFGPQTFTQDGQLNRSFLAAQVFGQPKRLAQLNGLVHPAVKRDFERWLQVRQDAGQRLCFKEAAIIFEAGTADQLDGVVLVTAPESVRIDRVQARDGLDEADIRSRMARQWPDAQKIPLADFVIQNDGVRLLLPQVVQMLRWAQTNR